MDRPSPAGGAYATALDMAKFGQMFLNGGTYGSMRVLSPAAVAAMIKDQIPGISANLLDMRFPDAGWGLGWSIGAPFKGRVYGEQLPTPHYFNHGGHGGVEMWVDPVNEIVGVFFSVALDTDDRDFTIHDADLFMNMVTAGVTGSGSPSSRRAAIKKTASDGTDPAAETTIGTKRILISGPKELRSGTAEEASADPKRVDRVIGLAQRWVTAGIHPSLVIVAARHGVVFLKEAFGRQGPEKNAPTLTKDALFPLASLTKPITAAAAMILVEEGSLSLNRRQPKRRC